jgi:small subunit ribosomal protein S2
MSYISMKQMLETGVHFGHQTRRWNPKMRPFIFGARNGIHIIDLQQTVKLFQKAHDFVADTVAGGGKIIFVGTKRQAQDSVKAEAERCEQFYVTNRWMGGMLTNFQTIKRSIDRLKKLEQMFEDGSINKFPKKEIVMMNREVTKLNSTLGGIKDLEKLPDAAFIIDPKREDIAVNECRKLHIPIVAVVDTNCDPDVIDYVIPGNDDAIRAIKLFVTHMAEACLEGRARYEESAAAQAEEAGAEAEQPRREKPEAPPSTAPEPARDPEEVAAETVEQDAGAAEAEARPVADTVQEAPEAEEPKAEESQEKKEEA